MARQIVRKHRKRKYVRQEPDHAKKAAAAAKAHAWRTEIRMATIDDLFSEGWSFAEAKIAVDRLVLHQQAMRKFIAGLAGLSTYAAWLENLKSQTALSGRRLHNVRQI